jgi:serine/threonine-protein kinase HipA
MRRAKVFMHSELAGILIENEDGYLFQYEKEYLNNPKATQVSLTLTIREEPFLSKTMFPFFDGLIPEGWLLEIAEKNWKLDARDRMGLLLACCRDCIGALSIEEDIS